ncbi:hypothetical protein CDEST_14772 [Colletotrichum destructivum]|uniref:SAP domain-containing protein n=1 Tax=Colletotrichum destructivum TaxID=34406 RepID=A0AAX4J2G2_9PEZI|nr:hypothetical protein CDEST_14772 [Colletotrichum destructivum]
MEVCRRVDGVRLTLDVSPVITSVHDPTSLPSNRTISVSPCSYQFTVSQCHVKPCRNRKERWSVLLHSQKVGDAAPAAASQFPELVVLRTKAATTRLKNRHNPRRSIHPSHHLARPLLSALPSSTSPLPSSISSRHPTAHSTPTSSHRNPVILSNHYSLPLLSVPPTVVVVVANMPTDYSSLKVPELKKLLQERGLPATGNKLDLVNRLKENDKQAAPATAEEDEIDYSDDEPAATKPAAATEAVPVVEDSAPASASATAEPTTAAAADDVAEPAGAALDAAPDAETTGEEGKKPEEAAETADEAPKENFALNLNATDAAAEAKKRADRAKRFGIDEDEEAKKKAERAKKFGVEVGSVAGLDSALPERRPKRGRPERAEEQSGRDAKRQSTDGRGGDGRRGRGNRNGHPGGRQAGGGDRGNRSGARDTRRTAAIDPAEKAKLDARAKRFAA